MQVFFDSMNSTIVTINPYSYQEYIRVLLSLYMNIILVLHYYMYVCHRYCRHVMEELLQTEVRLVADLKLILVSYMVVSKFLCAVTSLTYWPCISSLL